MADNFTKQYDFQFHSNGKMMGSSDVMSFREIDARLVEWWK